VISEPAKLWTASIGEVEVCHVPHVQPIVYMLLFHVLIFFVYQCHVQNFSDSCTVFGFILTSRPTSTMICRFTSPKSSFQPIGNATPPEATGF
jgi:hypothetical protein